MTSAQPVLTWKLLAAVLLVTAVVFVGLFDEPEFIYDDVAHVVQNPAIRDLGNVPSLFVQRYWGQHFEGGLYRPLVHVTYALEYAAFGLEPGFYRATNLLLHLVNTALVFALALALTDSRRVAFIAGLFFGLHPAHVEVVAGVVGRSELLAAAFTLGALWLFHRYLVHGGRGQLAGVVACVAAGLFSKETAVVAPVAMLLLIPLAREHWVACWRERRRELLGLAGALAVVGIAWLVLRGIALGGALAPEQDAALLAGTPLTERAAFAGFLVLRYGAWGFWPRGLSPDYALYPDQMAAPGVLDYLPLVITVIGAVLALVALWRGRPLAFGVLLFLLALVPVLQLVPIGVLLAVRFLYLPSVGLALVVGRLLQRPSLAWVTPGTAVAAGAFVMLTLGQVSVWRTNLGLWEYALAVEPESFVAHLQLGELRCRGEQWHEAREIYERAHELQPTDPRPVLGLARTALATGDLDAAMEHVRRAAPLAGTGPFDRDVLITQARILLERGEEATAAVSYREALAEGLVGPPRAEPHYYHGIRAARAGAFDEARQHLEAALALRPDLLDVRLNLARVYRDLGESIRGRALLEEALAALPEDSPESRTVRALLAELRRAP